MDEKTKKKSTALEQIGFKNISIILFILLVLVLLAVAADELFEDDDDDGGGSNVVYDPIIDPDNFVNEIDNPYLPLKVGNKWVYEAETEDGTERIEVTVTGDTKVIMGVTCIVVRDTVSLEGELIEDTYDWFAQDKDGNVWYFGEDSKEYDDGEVDTVGSWESDVDGAKPGVLMMAKPLAGFTYRQEYYKGEAEDMAEVVHLNETLTIDYGSYDNVLVTREWNPLEPGDEEQKYYAPGVGVIQEKQTKGGSEVVKLIEFTSG